MTLDREIDDFRQELLQPLDRQVLLEPRPSLGAPCKHAQVGVTTFVAGSGADHGPERGLDQRFRRTKGSPVGEVRAGRPGDLRPEQPTKR